MNFSGVLAAKVVGGLTVVSVPTAVGVAYTTGAIGNSVSATPKVQVPTPTPLTQKQKILTNLGLNSSDCGDVWKDDGCKLTKGAWKKMNFSNGINDGMIVDEAEVTDPNVELKVEFVEDDKDIFPSGTKIVFQGLTYELGARSGDKVMEVSGKFEFKIEEKNNKYQLANAWDARKLGEKVGCTVSVEGTTHKCTFEKNKTIRIKLEKESEERDVVLKNGGVFTIEKGRFYDRGIKFKAASDIDFEPEIKDATSTLRIKIENEDDFEMRLDNKGWIFWGVHK